MLICGCFRVSKKINSYVRLSNPNITKKTTKNRVASSPVRKSENLTLMYKMSRTEKKLKAGMNSSIILPDTFVGICLRYDLQ